MRAGQLDTRVIIQRSFKIVDEWGEDDVAWSDLATVYADVRQTTGREFLAAAMQQAQKRVVFYIRWFEGVTPLDRILHEGVAHNIVEVRPIGRRAGLELHTIAVA